MRAQLSLVEVTIGSSSITLAVAHLPDEDPLKTLCNEIVVGSSCEIKLLGQLREHYVAVGHEPLCDAGRLLGSRKKLP